MVFSVDIGLNDILKRAVEEENPVVFFSSIEAGLAAAMSEMNGTFTSDWDADKKDFYCKIRDLRNSFTEITKEIAHVKNLNATKFAKKEEDYF